MNHNSKRVQLPTILILFITLAFSSCVYENTDDCGYVNVGFDYSYNIHSSNAFGNQADHVVLYVFDQNDKLIYKESGDNENKSNSFAMRTNQLEAGKYKFVAWAKSDDIIHEEADFQVPDLVVGVSRLDELTYYMKRKNDIQADELNNMLVGMVESEIGISNETQNVVVPMGKVNKKIRLILLPYNGGTNLDVDDYSFRIIDEIGSGHINYDFSLLKDHAVTYRPYHIENVVPSPKETTKSGATIDRAAVVEINTSRLMVDNDPRLVIATKDDGKELIKVHLPWFLGLSKMEDFDSWDLQTYLDCQDEYTITFFLDGDTWMKGTIIINGWVINNLEVEE